MYIKSVHIENYKSYKGCFDISLNDGINILVGNNEAGKSTLIEAIHLALTGILNGRYLKNELSQYLFNNDIVNEYLDNLKNGRPASLPHILIELYIGGDDCPLFCGNANSHREDDCGLSYKITFDERYRDVYEELIKQDVKTLPIEYYDVVWTSFARDGSITSRNIPLKSALIDSSNTRYQNGSDVYISRIVKECLEPKEIVDITQAYRKMQEVFMGEESIGNINTRLKGASRISNKDVELSVDLSSKNAWENCLMTYLDKIPFNYIGKGEQCIVKTKLALAHKKAKEASIILMEEPENHLSYSKLNELIAAIKVYGSASNTVGEAIAITASNTTPSGGSPSSGTYQPEIYLQHALARLSFTMQSATGRSVNATYDYVKKITLKTSSNAFITGTGTMRIADGALGGGTKVAELTFTPKNDVSSNTTAILCGAAGVPVEVGYGLVAPLASVDMTLTVVVGKRDDTTDDRTLSANLSQITWKRGHTHKIQITLSNRAITVNADIVPGTESGSAGTGDVKPGGY